MKIKKHLAFDLGVLYPPLQWLQLLWHDNAETSYDNPKMGIVFWKDTF